MTHTTLTVEGMTCEACMSAVRDALELPGVHLVDVSLDTGVVDVDHARSVSVEVIVGAVEETGYEVRETRTE
ncbi:MAG TPA: heavy metal-associated domain-containing protein [Solirubrobacteraceae bacterium]|nr:heavy metal-associated domain-containing protein [Solirubrobacteraceae bacterium]